MLRGETLTPMGGSEGKGRGEAGGPGESVKTRGMGES